MSEALPSTDAPPARVLLATTNAGKLREALHIMEGLSLELLTLEALPGVPEPEETGVTFAENARIKALHYAAASGLPTIAEDSGLEIDALDNAPGVQSARYGGPAADYPDKFAMIFAELEKRGRLESPARFVCAVAMANNGRLIYEGCGTVEGVVKPPPRGEGGFGYDPIFYFPPYGQTLAEVSHSRKAAVSHRGRAFRALRQFLQFRSTP
jgi:XTP/dITP diphosphohydrolase